ESLAPELDSHRAPPSLTEAFARRSPGRRPVVGLDAIVRDGRPTPATFPYVQPRARRTRRTRPRLSPRRARLRATADGDGDLLLAESPGLCARGGPRARRKRPLGAGGRLRSHRPRARSASAAARPGR